MVASAYSLAVNTDGGQHTRYPAGNKPGSLLPPDSLVSSSETSNSIDLNWNYSSSGQQSFEVQQRIVGISDKWSPVASVGPTARFWHATGLPSSAHIGHRVRAVSDGVLSAWSAESWTDTLAPVGAVTDLSKIYKSWNFNNDPIGSALRDVPGIWTGNNDDTAKITDEFLHNGNRSVKCIIPTDAGGFGVTQYGYWGMGHNLDAPLVEGDEIWMRFSERFDPAWSWAGAGSNGAEETDKWMRLRRDHSAGGGSGHTEYHFGHTSAHAAGYPWYSAESIVIGPDSPWGPGGTGWEKGDSPNAPSLITLGDWHTYEMYIYLRGAFVDDGKVLCRFWKDGKWMGDVVGSPAYPHRTLDGAVQTVTDILWHTVWRRNVPEQYCWIADPAVAIRKNDGSRNDAQFMAVDEHGNPFIGLI